MNITKRNKLKKRNIFLYLFLSLLSLPPFVFSQNSTAPSNSNVTLNNPLQVNTIEDLLEGILGIVVVIATPIVIFFIIYSGFLYVTAQGDETKLTNAKKALMYAIIGGVLILGAYAIGEIIKNLVGSFT